MRPRSLAGKPICQVFGVEQQTYYCRLRHHDVCKASQQSIYASIIGVENTPFPEASGFPAAFLAN